MRAAGGSASQTATAAHQVHHAAWPPPGSLRRRERLTPHAAPPPGSPGNGYFENCVSKQLELRNCLDGAGNDQSHGAGCDFVVVVVKPGYCQIELNQALLHTGFSPGSCLAPWAFFFYPASVFSPLKLLP